MLVNGIETREEFAFFFGNRAEAIEAAGPVVAPAWEVASQECKSGLAARVRDIYEMQAAEAQPTVVSVVAAVQRPNPNLPLHQR